MRIRTTEALRRMGATTLRHPDVLTALIQAGEHDPEWSVRMSAKQTLAQFKEGLIQVPEALSAFLSRQPQRLPAEEIGGNGRPQRLNNLSSAAGSEPDLAAALHDPDPEKRARVIIRLKQPRTTNLRRLEVLPALIEIALHDTDGGIELSNEF